jgi:lactoylglutathione lyase
MGIEDLRVTAINHVVLNVTNLARSLDFYLGVLGFEDPRPPSGPGRTTAFLRCGLQGLDLFEVAGDVHGGGELDHIALNVVGGDVDGVVAELESAGVHIVERTRRNTVMITDPDGHSIEILPRSANQRRNELETTQLMN